jgi:hypothetical protein
MTVSVPYLWPRLTTCLTIRNVTTKSDILVEPRRLESTGTLNDIRERNGHYGASSSGRAHWWTREGTILSIQPDRIVRDRLYVEHAGRPGGNIDQAVRRATTTAWLFTTAGGR